MNAPIRFARKQTLHIPGRVPSRFPGPFPGLFLSPCGALAMALFAVVMMPPLQNVAAQEPIAQNRAAQQPSAELEPSSVATPSAKSSDDTSQAETKGSKKYDLRYHFEVGQTLRWEVKHAASVRTTMKGTTQTAKTWSESVKAWKVTEVNDRGEATFLHSVESVKMSNELPNRAKVEYNSQTDAKPPRGFEAAAQAIGIPLTMVRVDARGKVLKREARHKQPGRTSDEGPITLPLPTEPISLGHVWIHSQTREVSLRDGGKRRIQVRTRYELKQVKDSIASIDMEYQVLDPKVLRDPAIMAQLIQRQVRGTIQFDLQAGRVISQTQKIDRHVIGFSGPASSMHYVMQFDERILKPGEKIAKRPPQPAGPERPR